MDLELNGHLAVITGGASGIGLATGRGFAREGARVALWDTDPNVAARADELQQEFAVNCRGFTVDVSDEALVQLALTKTVEQLGDVDHLVHAAAIGSGKFGFPFTNLSPSDWPRILKTNVMGMVHVAHAIAPGLRERQRGTMIFLSSVAGQIGSQTDPPYSASKAANINFAQCMAKDLAPHGVRVNTICPGMVRTPLNHSVWAAWAANQPTDKWRSYDDWGSDKVRQIVPSQRWQEPADIADMAVFLSSARATHVIGQTINVDGGFVMHW